eukprot:2893031-Rhodomonas_salina.1
MLSGRTSGAQPLALSQTGVGALEHSVWKLCAASTVEQDAAMLAKQTPLDRIFPLNNVHAKGDGKKTEEMEQDGNAKGKKEDTKNSKEGGRKCKDATRHTEVTCAMAEPGRGMGRGGRQRGRGEPMPLWCPCACLDACCAMIGRADLGYHDSMRDVVYSPVIQLPCPCECATDLPSDPACRLRYGVLKQRMLRPGKE